MADLHSRKTDDNNPFGNQYFTELFNELYSPLCRYCMRFVADADIAEDIVQEQFVYLWERKKLLEGVNSAKSYLYISVKNRAISHLKKNSFNNSIQCLDDTDEHTSAAVLPDPATILEGKELERILEAALENLPERCRVIFSLKKFGELSNKEVAQKLNISIKTVEAQMTIAVKKLAHFISSHWHLSLILLLDYLNSNFFNNTF